jgi:hypothetical protein
VSIQLDGDLANASGTITAATLPPANKADRIGGGAISDEFCVKIALVDHESY